MEIPRSAAVEAAITDAANLLKIDRNELSEKYYAAMESIATDGPPRIEIPFQSLPTDLSASDPSLTIPFKLSLYKIIGLDGEITYHHNDGNWTIEVRVGISLLGNTVTNEHYVFGPSHLEQCVSVDVKLASAKICFGIKQRHLCVFVSGEACYFNPFTGKQCEDFNEDIVCFT